MLRNPGFLSFPARRRLFQGRGQRRKERQRREQEPFEGRRKCNPAVIPSTLGGALPMKDRKKGTQHVNVTKSKHLWAGVVPPFIVCTPSNWVHLDLWPLTCEVLSRMMCDLFDSRVMRTTSCTLMAINDNHGKVDFIVFPHLQLPPARCRPPALLQAARITQNEITLAYTRLVLLLTLAGCFFCLPWKPRNPDLHS